MESRPKPWPGPGQAHGLRYQPALDGLRGTAVLAVLAYHANLSFVPGGFLGVDLFFVLSGYLITALLLTEWTATGRIDLGRFWVRRARRLLPALLLMLTAVAAYAAFIADAGQHDRLRADGLATLAYVANWQQVLAQLSYFEQFQDPSLLKHAWSLGIEEQYYLAWPLLLLGALALLARRRAAVGPSPAAPPAAPPADRSAAPRRLGWLLVITLLVASASAALMAVLYEPGTDPSRVYYGTDTRAQALLVGGAIAMFTAWRAARATGRRATRRATPGGLRALGARLAALLTAGAGPVALGVLAVLLAAVRDRDDRMYQGGLLLVAVVAGVVIAAAVRDRGLVRRALAVQPLRLVGVVSYGLYLWHWPVYVLLTPDRTGWSGGALLAARLTVTFAAALASYVLVERPIRRGPPLAGRGLATATGTITATACLLVLATTGARTALPGTALAAGAGDELPGAGRPLGDPGTVVAPGVLAAPVVRGGEPGGGAEAARRPGRPQVRGDRDLRVFIGGDSVALTLTVNISPQMEADAGMRVADAVELGCGVARARNFIDGQPAPQAPACVRWPEAWRDTLRGFDADAAVVFIGAWEVYDKYSLGEVLEVGTPAYEAYLQEELEFALATLTEGGVRRVLITNVPCFEVRDTGLTSESDARNDPARGAWVNQVLGRFAGRHPGVVSILDLRGFLCRGADGSRYLDRLGGVKLRGDGVHLTPAGAELVWDWLVARVDAAVRVPAGGGPGAQTASGPSR